MPVFFFVISFGIWASLENRHEISELKEKIETLTWPNAILSFADCPDNAVRDHLRHAKRISLSGLSFYRFIPMYSNDLLESLLNVATLEIILSDPASDAVKMASF